MGVKITISGVEANGGKILTGCSIKGKNTNIQIKNLKMESDAELLNEMSVKGKNAGVDIAINGANMGKGSSMLNDMSVSGKLSVTASDLEVATGATVMDGKIVRDGENVVVDLNKSHKGDDKTDKEDSPKKPVRRGVLSFLFGKKDEQGASKDAGKPSRQTTIQERVSGNGKFRDPKYSQADTGVGSQGAAEQDKGHMR